MDIYHIALSRELIGYSVKLKIRAFKQVYDFEIDKITKCQIVGGNVILTGDISPDPNGKIRCRKMVIGYDNNVFYTSDYEKNVESIKVTDNNTIEFFREEPHVHNRLG